MRSIDVLDARNKLGQLLNLVEQGQEFTITRYGREVARLFGARAVSP
jgi:prevent-host-death family protein